MGRIRAQNLRILGCALISTCNRTELYLSCAPESDLKPDEILCGAVGLEYAPFAGAFVTRRGSAAARHLMDCLLYTSTSSTVRENQSLGIGSTSLSREEYAYRSVPMVTPSWICLLYTSVGEGGFREDLQGFVVVYLMPAENTAVAVVGILAHTHVGDEIELRMFGLDGTNRLLDHTLLVPGGRALRILLCREPEEDPDVYKRQPRRWKIEHPGPR